MATTFSNKVDILEQLWSFHRSTDHFVDFVSYHKLGIPLACLASRGYSEPTEKGTSYINEIWNELLEQIGIEDTGFEHIDDVLTAGNVIIVE
jgi:hypothetical protein